MTPAHLAARPSALRRPLPRYPRVAARQASTVALAAVLLLSLAAATARAQSFTPAPRLDFTVGSYPILVATGDLNGDGLADIVTANNTGSSMSVMLGTGGGLYAARTDYATGINPSSIALGDINGDGILDAAVTCLGTPCVSLFLGNGTGGFGARTDITTAAQCMSVAIADVNGDGRADLVVANGATSTVSVFLANGTGGFRPRADYVTGTYAYQVMVGDVNEDGRPDLVVANGTSSTVSVLLGTGTGTFGAKTDFATGTKPQSLVLTDLNSDGHLDIATGNYTASTISVLLGTGTGSFGARTDFICGTGPLGITAGDLDGDGKVDLVTANFGTSTNSVLIGTGTGSFGAKTDFATGASPRSVTIADLNNDGARDVVSANGGANAVGILLGTGGAGFGARVEYAAPATSVRSVQIGDLDNDGNPDVVAACVGALQWMGLGGGALSACVENYVNGANRVATGDLNHDGNLDLAVLTSGGSVSILLGKGDGAYTSGTANSVGGYATGIAIADMNRDGVPDLLGIASLGQKLSVQLGDGSGVFGPATVYVTGTYPAGLGVADLSGDGIPDVVTANQSVDSISVRLGDGLGGLLARTDYAAGWTPQKVAFGDVNGDGRPDVAVVNAGSASVTVWLGNGVGGLTTRTDVTVGSGPYDLALADLNGDGRLDLATANYDGTVSILLGNGAGGFGSPLSIAGTLNAYSIAVGDLNGDGRPDLAVGGNTLAILLALSYTRTTLAASTTTTPLGTAVLLTAHVGAVIAGTGTPGASVRFFDGTTLLGTAPVVGGTAALWTTASRLGIRSFSASFTGDTRFLASHSAPVVARVVSSASPALAGISDIRNDQGRQVRVRFRASGFDYAASATPIVKYDVYRLVAPGLAPASLQPAGGRATGPAAAQLDGWDIVGTQSATADSAYVLVAPTLADSNSTGLHRATFMVRAMTAAPAVYYDSAPDSGYSVDNLPPVIPAPFVAAYAAGATHLHWGPSTESDFWYYKVYRGTSAGFTPAAGNLVATRSDTGYLDTGAAGGFYKLSAVDVNGNESAFALVAPTGTTGVGQGPLAFALHGVTPNPARGGRAGVAFTLPDASRATLELLDVAGRRVVSRDVGSLGAGRHGVELAADHALAPGLYLVRLTRGSTSRTARVCVIE